MSAALHKFEIVNLFKAFVFFVEHAHEFILLVNNEHQHMGKLKSRFFTYGYPRNYPCDVGHLGDLDKAVGAGVIVVLLEVKSGDEPAPCAVGGIAAVENHRFADVLKSPVGKIALHSVGALVIILVAGKKPCLRKNHI